MAQTYTTTRSERQAAYRDYLRTPRWHVLRWLRKVRDGGVCRDCLRVAGQSRGGHRPHGRPAA